MSDVMFSLSLPVHVMILGKERAKPLMLEVWRVCFLLLLSEAQVCIPTDCDHTLRYTQPDSTL